MPKNPSYFFAVFSASSNLFDKSSLGIFPAKHADFPLNPSDSKDAPVIIYEFPVENPAYGLYVAGVDPYRQGQAKYCNSLGAVYIYKRMHDLTGEKFQDMFVASYVARPEKKETWEEQARLLIKYYNARTLCENDEISFIEYMKSKEMLIIWKHNQDGY